MIMNIKRRVVAGVMAAIMLVGFMIPVQARVADEESNYEWSLRLLSGWAIELDMTIDEIMDYARANSYPYMFAFDRNSTESLSEQIGAEMISFLDRVMAVYSYRRIVPLMRSFLDELGLTFTEAFLYPATVNLEDFAEYFGVSIADASHAVAHYSAATQLMFARDEPYEGGIRVFFNGMQVEFDQPPIMQDGRTLVPLRAIFEAMGADIDWDGDTQTVTAVRAGAIVTMQVGNPVITVNGNNLTLDVPPILYGGRTLVPARAVAESFGANVEWDGVSQAIFINTDDFINANVFNSGEIPF